MLKKFYDNYGILGKLTEDVIIKIFKDLNFIATTDLTTNKIIKKEKNWQWFIFWNRFI
ncbi:hypothetical protein NWQ34_00070 [Mycoplasmopsis felis]|uniref:hypothetical protein n=1 Tax=Mycoplasmopsis felis TaxID=33923 RepID=UPI0021DF903A|nr:hypothetical protein [Mycoplasmopsis felis]MCU9938132.1 hypothetical protein [Mycoplasmopsis felis]